MTTQEPEVWMSCREAARILGLSYQRADQLCTDGTLPFVKTTFGVRLVHGPSVERLRQEREQRQNKSHPGLATEVR